MPEIDFSRLLGLGQIVITPNARHSLSPQEILNALRRHARGDHGDFQPPRPGCRQRPKLGGCRRLSAYRTVDGTRFWVISEADQPLTTVLLPEEY